MSLNAGSVYATLGARFNHDAFTRFDAAMRRSETSTGRFEQAFTRSMGRSHTAARLLATGATAAATGGLALLAGGMVATVKKAADFESQLSSLGAVANASGRQLDLLRKQAMDAGAATKFSALEAAQAQTELAKGGLSTSKILGGALNGALALAAAGELDLADAASYTANALNQFGLDGKQAGHVADALAQAANSTTADVGDFGIALTQGGAAAKAAGLSFDETVTALEALAKIGVKGSDAGTSLKTALTQIASPTKKSAELMDQLGISFFDAQGKMKPLPAVAGMLHDKLEGLTRQQRLQAASTIAGTDGMRTLLALYDAGGPTIHKLAGELEKQGTAAEVAAKKQDNLKGKIENLKGSLETAAIAVGTELIPVLTDSAEKLTALVNKAAADGDIKRFGETLAHGLEDAVNAIPDIVHGMGEVAGAAGDAYGAVSPLVHLIASVDPSLLIGAAAGLAGFRVAQTVYPAVASLAGALGNVVAAARTAPTASAFVGDLVGMTNPTIALGTAFIGAGAAIAYLATRENDEEAAARRSAEAKRDQAQAVRDLRDAVNESADKELAAKRADVERERAQNHLKDTQKQVRDGELKGRDAAIALRDARLGVKETALHAREANEAYTKSLHATTAAETKARDAAKARMDTARDELHTAKGIVDTDKANNFQVPEHLRRLANAERENAAAIDAWRTAVQQGSTVEVDRERRMRGLEAITAKNRVGVLALANSIEGLPKTKQTKLLMSDQDVVSKLGRAFTQLAIYGRTKAAAKVLANTSSARQALVQLQQMLNGLHDRDINVRVHTQQTGGGASRPGSTSGTGHGGAAHAAGRGAGAGERALVGEGRDPREYVVDGETGAGYVTSGPMLVDLKPQDYVVPVDRHQRGRALGLFRMLAKDLGVEAFDKGKKGKHLGVPKKLDPLRLPVDDLEHVESRSHTTYEKAHDAERDLPAKIKTARASLRDVERRQPRSKEQRANKADDRKRARAKVRELDKQLHQARRDAPKLRAEWHQRKRELHDARQYQAQITKQEDLVEIARNQMAAAATRGDEKAWETAKAARDGALGERRRLLTDAQGHVKKGSAYWRALQKDITGIDSDQATGGKETFDRADAPALDTVPADLARDLALAQLTATSDDDKGVLAQIESFQAGLLAQLQGGAGTPEQITEVAQALKSTRDEIGQLAGAAAGGSSDPDLQAQLEQSRAREAAASQRAQIAEGALTVFGSSGELGVLPAGRSAPAPQIVIQTLHPGDPNTLRAVGDAATGGQSLQGSRRATREFVGL